MMKCPRCGLRVRRVAGKGVNGPARHNARGKPCVRIPDVENPGGTPGQGAPPDSHTQPVPEPNYLLVMQTRGIVIKGEVYVVSGEHMAAAWADLAEKLHALGIRSVPAAKTEPAQG